MESMETTVMEQKSEKAAEQEITNDVCSKNEVKDTTVPIKQTDLAICETEAEEPKGLHYSLFDTICKVHEKSSNKYPYNDKLYHITFSWQALLQCHLPISKKNFGDLYRLTTYYIFGGGWPQESPVSQNYLLSILGQCAARNNGDPSIKDQCIKLKNAAHGLWEDAVLCRILRTWTDTLEVDFFKSRNGKIIWTQLDIMLVSRCEECAIRLAGACFKTHRAHSLFDYDYTQVEINYALDIYLMGLYDVDNLEKIVTVLKLFTLEENIRLLERYNKEGGLGKKYSNAQNAAIWEDSTYTLEYISHYILASSMLNNADSDLFEKLCAQWAIIYHSKLRLISVGELQNLVNKLIKPASSSKQLYQLCVSLMRVGNNLRLLYLPLLIHAITVNGNEVEYFKLRQQKDKETKSSQTLSEGYTLLSTLLEESDFIYRQCILAAFDIFPTIECLDKLTEILNNWIPIESEDEILIHIEKIGQLYPYISDDVKEDLISLLSIPRHYSLRWNIGAEQLKINSKYYLENFEEFRQDPELKYLHIDYSKQPVLRKSAETFEESEISEPVVVLPVIDSSTTSDSDSDWVLDSSPPKGKEKKKKVCKRKISKERKPRTGGKPKRGRPKKIIFLDSESDDDVVVSSL